MYYKILQYIIALDSSSWIGTVKIVGRKKFDFVQSNVPIGSVIWLYNNILFIYQ